MRSEGTSSVDGDSGSGGNVSGEPSARCLPFTVYRLPFSGDDLLILGWCRLILEFLEFDRRERWTVDGRRQTEDGGGKPPPSSHFSYIWVVRCGPYLGG